MIRFAKRRVLVDSVIAEGSGLIVQITLIRAFPEREG